MTLDKLIHDVNSKCSSLKDAAKLLPDSPAAERKELLALMVDQARALADELAAFERAP
jgi:acyl-CoA reductase-like NAD-dependent aldehyde dehydrogenase